MDSVPDNSKPLDEGGVKRLQKFVGLLLYHVRVVNSPVLLALNTIGSEQASGTEAIANVVT